MSLVFRYVKSDKPAVPVTLRQRGEIKTTALIDSGGDISLLPPFLATKVLGSVYLRKPPNQTLRGISGMSKGVQCDIDICITDGKESYTVKNVPFFIPREPRDFVIIGREVFFDFFDITFKHRLGEIILTPVSTECQKIGGQVSRVD